MAPMLRLLAPIMKWYAGLDACIGLIRQGPPCVHLAVMIFKRGGFDGGECLAIPQRTESWHPILLSQFLSGKTQACL